MLFWVNLACADPSTQPGMCNQHANVSRSEQISIGDSSSMLFCGEAKGIESNERLSDSQMPCVAARGSSAVVPTERKEETGNAVTSSINGSYRGRGFAVAGQ